MPSSIHKRGPTTPAMNLTPLIDVVFLLIVFFMLVSTIVSHEAAPMIVPRLDDPETRSMADEGRVIVSIVPQAFNRQDRAADPLLFEGTPEKVQVGTKQFAMHELSKVTAELQRLLTQAQEKGQPLEVVLRADAALYYDQVQPVMAAITAAGIETVKMVAYMPGDGPGDR